MGYKEIYLVTRFIFNVIYEIVDSLCKVKHCLTAVIAVDKIPF